MQVEQTKDKLSLWAAEARRLGMRYGDYVAKYHPAAPVADSRQKAKQPPEPVFGQQKRKVCLCCGGEIPADSRRRLYCSKDCAMGAHEEQKMRRQDRIRRGEPV